jgi:hypothetical protein
MINQAFKALEETEPTSSDSKKWMAAGEDILAKLYGLT